MLAGTVAGGAARWQQERWSGRQTDGAQINHQASASQSATLTACSVVNALVCRRESSLEQSRGNMWVTSGCLGLLSWLGQQSDLCRAVWQRGMEGCCGGGVAT